MASKEQKRNKNTHRDTTILSSLDFCYTFLHKRSYRVVVSAAEEHSFNFQQGYNTPHPNRHHHRFPTFSLQLDNMLIMLRQTDCTERAGDQSSVSIDRQMWPLLYTWGWIGIFSPVNITWKNNDQLVRSFVKYFIISLKKDRISCLKTEGFWITLIVFLYFTLNWGHFVGQR